MVRRLSLDRSLLPSILDQKPNLQVVIGFVQTFYNLSLHPVLRIRSFFSGSGSADPVF